MRENHVVEFRPLLYCKKVILVQRTSHYTR